MGPGGDWGEGRGAGGREEDVDFKGRWLGVGGRVGGVEGRHVGGIVSRDGGLLSSGWVGVAVVVLWWAYR